MSPPSTALSPEPGVPRVALVAAPEIARTPGTALGQWSAYVELAKPGVTRLVMVTTWCGAAIAPGAVRLPELAAALFGTTAVVASANAFNMVLERDVDAQMERTRNRPLPSGRLSREAAVSFAVIAGFLGLVTLLTWVNVASTLLALGALGSYVWLYTPMKRISPWAVQLGAVPGAAPPVIGWAAMTGGVDVAAMSLFAVLFVWQIPHFHAISIFRKEEYARAKLRVLSVARGNAVAKRSALGWALLLTVASLTPTWANVAGNGYAFVALVSSLVFVGFCVRGLRAKDERAAARVTFFASMPHNILLFASLVIATW